MFKFLVILILLTSVNTNKHFHQDKKDWIDPGVMFDISTPQDDINNDTSQELDLASPSEKSHPIIQDKNLKKAIELFGEKVPISREESWIYLYEKIRLSRNSAEKIFIKRFLKRLLREFDKWDSDTLILNFHVTKDEQKILQGAIDHKSDVASIDDILMKLFSDISTPQSNLPYFQSPSDVLELLTSGKGLLVMSVLLIIIVIHWFRTTKITFMRAMFTTFVLLCFVSFFWEWIGLYKHEVSKQHRIMMKYSELPEDCKTDKISWWTYLFGTQTNCEEYYDNLMIDPVWRVTFIAAFGETVSKLLTQPMGHIGDGMTKFSNALISKLPFYVAIPVLVLTTFLMFLAMYFILCLIFGIGFKVKFFGFALEPVNLFPHQQVADRHSRVEEIKEEEKLPIKDATKPNCLVKGQNKSIQTDFSIVEHDVQNLKAAKEPLSIEDQHVRKKSSTDFEQCDKQIENDKNSVTNSHSTDASSDREIWAMLATDGNCDKNNGIKSSKIEEIHSENSH